MPEQRWPGDCYRIYKQKTHMEILIMNVTSYTYYDKRFTMPQFLYVDADCDRKLLPNNVKEIMKKSKVARKVSYDVIQRQGKAVEEFFAAKHYLDGVSDMIEHS